MKKSIGILDYPKRFSTILATVGILLTAVGGLSLTGCSSLSSGINGGGGSQSEKAAKMVLTADQAPEADWQQLNRYNPKVDNGCLSIDTPCLKLSSSWLAPRAVDPYEVGDRMGLSMDSAESTSSNCISVSTDNNMGKTSICAYENDSQSGSYKIDLQMSRK